MLNVHDDLQMQDIGAGLCLVENGFDVDQKALFEYINWLKEVEEDTFVYVEEDGKTFAINKTGFKFDPNEVSLAPERFVDPLCKLSDRKPTQNQINFINGLEDLVYRALVDYCKIYTEASTVCWWRSFGHIATYANGQGIGQHCDDQIPFEWGKAPKNEYPKHSNVSINIYLNNGVDDITQVNEHTFLGGDILFKHAKFRLKPKSGILVVYPTNYVGTHEVEPVIAGKRITYLSAALYGTPESASPIPVEGDSRIWMPNLRKDAGLEL